MCNGVDSVYKMVVTNFELTPDSPLNFDITFARNVQTVTFECVHTSVKVVGKFRALGHLILADAIFTNHFATISFQFKYAIST